MIVCDCKNTDAEKKGCLNGTGKVDGEKGN